MEAFLNMDADIVIWLNNGVGRFDILDDLGYLIVSDYFIPLVMCFWMLGLWVAGPHPEARSRNQKAVLAAAIALGFANLAVLLINQIWFRERPFAVYELTNLLYEPTDSSFPANPAAIAFATATAIFLSNHRASVFLFTIAIVWSVARISNGLHYPTDVAAGALIGISIAVIISFGMRRIEPVPTWVLKGVRLLHLA